jgi:hypothetical protein
MVFVLGNLPDNIEEDDIKELFNNSTILTDVNFFETNGNHHPSEYECTVTLDLKSPIAGLAMQNKLHHYCWKGRCIHAHMLFH